MSNGRNCDNCETHLNDEDYVSYGSWSYTCHDCGFVYRHGSAGVGEQVAKFNSRPTKRAVDKWRALGWADYSAKEKQCK